MVSRRRGQRPGLGSGGRASRRGARAEGQPRAPPGAPQGVERGARAAPRLPGVPRAAPYVGAAQGRRSEERRVGKECRSRWAPDEEKKESKTQCRDDV